jgi:hypothetical protein
MMAANPLGEHRAFAKPATTRCDLHPRG